jgi:hypothetical protein
MSLFEGSKKGIKAEKELKNKCKRKYLWEKYDKEILLMEQEKKLDFHLMTTLKNQIMCKLYKGTKKACVNGKVQKPINVNGPQT